MKAVGFHTHLPIDDPQSLVDLDIPTPQPSGRDLLVRVEAISVNPVDAKQRGASAKLHSAADGGLRILGWDAAGIVDAVGPDVTLYRPGDAVYYAGSVTRPGANSEFHLVDERIVGTKPATLDWVQAAALPLTSITAWEGLFERLGIAADGSDAGRGLLIINGAGGVGSVAIQLAKQLARLHVTASASRSSSADWCRSLGADRIIDHKGDMAAQLQDAGGPAIDFVLVCSTVDEHLAAVAALIAPQGKVCAIAETGAPLPVALLKQKSVSFTWEYMFTRAMFQTADMIEQQRLLNEVARLVDAGVLRTTVGENLGRIDAANLRRAHAMLEGGRTIGKIVLSGF
ncbi:MAG: zinc-binding alcohol dehydrogenase family protein [Janthinobacterium lividum]